MTFDKLYQNKYVHLITIAFIAVVFLFEPQAVLQNDLDSAVRWASNHLFHFGSNDLLLYPHTNGPLFLLKFPIPIGKSILAAVLFDLLLKFLLGCYLLKVSRIYRPSNFWLPISVFVGFCVFLSFDFIIISIVLATCLLALNKHRHFALIPGLLILVLSIFIKASISFPALFIFGSTIVLLFIQKNISYAVRIIGIFSIAFITLVLILYGFRMDGFSWIFKALIKTLGYGNDQAVFFNNFLPYILLTVLFIILPTVLIKNKISKNFFFITALAIFAVWKYALGRQDFTHYQAWFILCILLAGFIVLINGKRGALIGASCYLLSFGFFITNTKRGDSPKHFIYNTPRIDYLPKVLLRYDKVTEEYQQKSNEYLSNAILSDSTLQLIGTQTVDIFPWGLPVLYKYNLNYKARGNFHSTILGMDADRDDSTHFQNKTQAPEFILWHNSQPSLYALNGHNQIYLPNATPKAISSILTNYKLVRYEAAYALWQKTEKLVPKKTASGQSKSIKLFEWFAPPLLDSNLAIWGSTNFELPLIDKVRSSIYKGRFFKIHYKLKNGQTAVHFLSLSSLQYGFLIQPYFVDPSMRFEVVDEIMIEPMDTNFRGLELQLSPDWSPYLPY